MRWPAAVLSSSPRGSGPRPRAGAFGFYAFAMSIGLATLLASACNGTPGLGITTSLGGGTTSSGKGGAGGTPVDGGTGGGGGSISFFDGGFPEAGYGVCVPLTCSELKATCGPQGDGCGNVIQCGNCASPATCGGGGTASACGTSTSCVKLTCTDWGADCGAVSDGCGGIVQCGSCTAPAVCGGGGMPSVCGGNSGCVPTTCADQNVNCGPLSNGCGGLLQCGSCVAPQSCGGSVHGQCGISDIDAGVTCVPKSCTDLGLNCGPAGDGCGGELQCGSCSSPQSCGGGGTPSVCGGNTGCVPATCAELGLDCGPAGDGCGGELQCGSCTAPETCGGAGTPGVCGGFNACVPKTCAELGMNCGPTGDGCGGLVQCGSCSAPEICGGGGQPGVCGPTVDAGSTSCTGLCALQTTCSPSTVTTTISGTVLAPNGTDPLYNALVYIPNGGAAPAYGVTAFSPGVHCGQCGSEVSGSPLVQTLTAPDGTFTLENVPVGTNIPLVIQTGRWRRKISIPTVAKCTNTALSSAQTRLPSSQPGSSTYPPSWYPAGGGDVADNIPLIAFSTGAVDGLECVLLKIGVDQSQYSDPATQGGSGRIRFYLGDSSPTGAAGPGAKFSAKTPSATQLFSGTTPDINQYDMVFFPCQGQQQVEATTSQTNVINYANAGGRIFTTHYSYAWLYNDAPFSTTATWDINQASADNGTGVINTTFARGQALAQWLQINGASTTYAQIPLNTLREDFNAVAPASLLWVNLTPAGGSWPMHYTFDTPVGTPAASQCGRVLFDDFHVENATYNYGLTFPAECPASVMTAQEKMLEFMIFDLGSCIIPTAPPTPPTCTPVTCGQQGFNCGPAGDGCGNEIMCGTCPTGETCGGGGTPGVCGGAACAALSCASQNIQCGPAGDGCGNLIECGNCPNGETCGGGGTPGKCGKPACAPVTCAAQGIQCGPTGDGCGGVFQCGTCPPGETCGGNGPGKCGAPDGSACAPLSCTAQGIQCGPAGNGCGGQIDCGTCPAGQTCGGGGMAGICGSPACTMTSCAALKLNCGPAGDGCGGTLQCGTCPANETCGGGGTPGVCGSTCTKLTCAAEKVQCGPASDGCGGLIQCGTCTAPDTCGGGGTPGVCGNLQTN